MFLALVGNRNPAPATPHGMYFPSTPLPSVPSPVHVGKVARSSRGGLIRSWDGGINGGGEFGTFCA